MPKVPKSFGYSIPLSADVTADLRIRGGKLTPEHVRTLRAHLAILERALSHEAEHGELETEKLDPVVTGGIVQIRPSADPILGGLMMRVTKSRGNEVKGYLLVPHRGGHAEMWQTYTQAEVVRIGRVKWGEAEWGFSDDAKRQRRRMWID